MLPTDVCKRENYGGCLCFILTNTIYTVASLLAIEPPVAQCLERRGTQRQFSENICSEDDLRSRIFGTFAVKFLACLPLLGFANI